MLTHWSFVFLALTYQNYIMLCNYQRQNMNKNFNSHQVPYASPSQTSHWVFIPKLFAFHDCWIFLTKGQLWESVSISWYFEDDNESDDFLCFTPPKGWVKSGCPWHFTSVSWLGAAIYWPQLTVQLRYTLPQLSTYGSNVQGQNCKLLSSINHVPEQWALLISQK